MKHLLAVLVFLLLCLPTLAQDATLEATVDTAPVTVIEGEGGDIDVIVEAPDAPIETPADNTPVAWIALGIGALTSILVGISLGLQVLGNRAAAISADPSAISLLERGYETVLPGAIKAAVDPLKESLERSDKALQQVIDLVRKLTDGVPESAKKTDAMSRPTTPSSGGYVTTSTAPTSLTDVHGSSDPEFRGKP